MANVTALADWLTANGLKKGERVAVMGKNSPEWATAYLAALFASGIVVPVDNGIDKACHSNDFPSAVKELLDFDKAIAEAIKFADQDGNTLVIVSADHETSGLSLWDGDPSKGNVEGVHITGSHTPSPVPLFAYGPHAQDFMGFQGNEQVAQKILKLLLQ